MIGKVYCKDHPHLSTTLTSVKVRVQTRSNIQPKVSISKPGESEQSAILKCEVYDTW